MAEHKFLDISGLAYYHTEIVSEDLAGLSDKDHTHVGLPSKAEKHTVSMLEDVSVYGVLEAGEKQLAITSPYFRSDGIVTIYTSDFSRIPNYAYVFPTKKILIKFPKAYDTDLEVMVVIRSSEYKSGKYVDTSDATATENDIVSGYNGYVNGELVSGKIPQYTGSNTITPSASDVTIPSGTAIAKNITIAKDDNLTSKNIKEGVSIFGVTGSYKGINVTINGLPYASPVEDFTLNVFTDSNGKLYIK